MPGIRATVERAFAPGTFDNLMGNSILWVDDNPSNNELTVRALRKFPLEIEQVKIIDAAVAALDRRRFD